MRTRTKKTKVKTHARKPAKSMKEPASPAIDYEALVRDADDATLESIVNASHNERERRNAERKPPAMTDGVKPSEVHAN